MPTRALFTITTGRSGTAYLAELLRLNVPGAECHHEILSYAGFGVDSPDLSDLTQFNALGNTVKVQRFWAQKFARIAAKECSLYVETSHQLAKAGLLENLTRLTSEGVDVLIVDLRRDVTKTVCSLIRRYDFLNKGNMWLWYLDPDYPKKILDPAVLLPRGWLGLCLWYVCEMRTRAEYYRLLLADQPVQFLQVDVDELNAPDGVVPFLHSVGFDVPTPRIPPPQNTVQVRDLDTAEMDAVAQLVDATPFDPAALAQQFFDSGRRIG